MMEISTMSQNKKNLEGSWFFRPVSATIFSAQTGRTRKVQLLEGISGGQLSAENSVRFTPLFREGERNGKRKIQKITNDGADRILFGGARD